MPPYQRQEISRGRRRIGTGQIIDALLDTVEHILADVAGHDPRTQLAGLSSMVDRRIDHASEHASGIENPIQVARGVGGRSLDPRLQLVQVALTPMGELPERPKRQTPSLPKPTQSYAEARVDE
ncbi:hypothetical protein GCM10027452_12700 [Micromonospora halotolerans]